MSTRRRARTRQAAATAALLSAAVTVSLVVGCTGKSASPDDSRGTSRTPTGSVTTMPAAGSVLAVKIDNASAARPQTGLNAADVVYAEQVEGGLSRLMAVYATRLPKQVGPVRSARESDLELLRQFDRPTLAFSGAQGKLMPLIDRAPLVPEPPGRASGAYVRDDARPAPHNLYLRPERLLPSAPGAAALTTGFHVGRAPSGGAAKTSFSVRYPAARFTFTWSGSERGWRVAMDGTAARTTDGKPLAPPTVVVQYVKIRASTFHDFLGNNTPYTETVGSGSATVLRDGRAYDVDWKRPKAEDGTTFTTKDGRTANFAEGQVWVVFAKK